MDSKKNKQYKMIVQMSSKVDFAVWDECVSGQSLWPRVSGGRGEWEQSRERFEHPDCLVGQTVFASASFGPESLQSPPRQQQAEETMRWVGSPAILVALRVW